MLCQSWNNLTLSQDEFKQWFRAKAHVMLAPGRTPFESVDLQLPNGDRSISAAHKEHRGKFAERQPAQVPQWKTVFFLGFFVAFVAHRRRIPDSRSKRHLS